MRVLIIEDEPLMANNLEKQVKEVDPEISVVGKFESVKGTLDYLSENEMPDLFFSDIELTDGLSFEIFSRLEKLVPVIFCTAHNEYALEAFRANGIDYLLKPFEDSAIKETIRKYKSLRENPTHSPDLSKVVNQLLNQSQKRENTSLIVHQGRKMFPVKYEDMRLFFLKDGVTYVITENARKYIISNSLDSIEEVLGRAFYRLNRQVIIHRDAVGHIDSYFARKLLVTPVFKVDFDIIVSKANASNFLRWLEKN